MHGIGMVWHRSHHRPSASGGFEANDLFPLCFSVDRLRAVPRVAIGPQIVAVWPVGLGVTVYGVAYLFVHDVYIHDRLAVPAPDAWRTSSGCATPTSSTTATAASPTGCCSRWCPELRRATTPTSRRWRPTVRSSVAVDDVIRRTRSRL